jgi:SAM-dependent methyltransferase
LDRYPAFAQARTYLQRMIVDNGYRSVADAGGGANAILDPEFVATHGIRYFLLDRSAHELAQANSRFEKIEADVEASDLQFRESTGARKFDFIFSHMLLEHLRDPLQAHRNFFAALHPGGRCVHIYPSPNNLPLALNRWLPEPVSRRLVRFAQPDRDFDGTQRKFKAYYRLCGAPSAALDATFEKIGFTVHQHTGYIGHTYYERFRLAAALERRFRTLAHQYHLPLTTGCLLVLDKPA